MIHPDAQPIAHHPPRPRIDLNARKATPAEYDPYENLGKAFREAENRRIWEYLEQAAQGGGTK